MGIDTLPAWANEPDPDRMEVINGELVQEQVPDAPTRIAGREVFAKLNMPIEGTEVMVTHDPANRAFEGRSGTVVEIMWSKVLDIVYVVEMHNTPPGFTGTYRLYEYDQLTRNE